MEKSRFLKESAFFCFVFCFVFYAVTALVNATADMMVYAVMYIFITSSQKKKSVKKSLQCMEEFLIFVNY